MGVIDRVRAALQPVYERATPVSMDQWADMFGFWGTYPWGSTMGTPREEINETYVGLAARAYRSNPVVFACMQSRMSIFSEARFQFQRLRKGKPGTLYGSPELGLLEVPWPGGTTSDLLARAIQDVDLAGNAFFIRRPGRIKRLRPDWVTIVVGSRRDPEMSPYDVDAETIGYIYHPGGRGSGIPEETYLPEVVGHFAPIPDPAFRFRGMSWLTPLIREIMADSAMSAHKLKYTEQGATPNMVVKLDVDNLDKFTAWVAKLEEKSAGTANAYRTLYLGAGADATVVGSTPQQQDFKSVQGAGETRIAAAAGIHPVIVGLSEGLAGSSLNAGNFNSARRLTADKTFRPLWHNFADSIAPIINVPSDSRLWYDEGEIPFLAEDLKDRAEVDQMQASTIKTLVDSGYTADSVIAALVADDWTLLEHSGLFSVQLQAPGSTKMPVPADVQPGPEGALPAATTPAGPGTKTLVPAGPATNGQKPAGG